MLGALPTRLQPFVSLSGERVRLSKAIEFGGLGRVQRCGWQSPLFFHRVIRSLSWRPKCTMPTRLRRQTIRITINRHYRHIKGTDGAITQLWTTYLAINQRGGIEPERPVSFGLWRRVEGMFMVCSHANAQLCYISHISLRGGVTNLNAIMGGFTGGAVKVTENIRQPRQRRANRAAEG